MDAAAILLDSGVFVMLKGIALRNMALREVRPMRIKRSYKDGGVRAKASKRRPIDSAKLLPVGPNPS